jgi:hypothetical protein
VGAGHRGVGDVLAREQRDRKFVTAAEALEGMGERHRKKFFWRQSLKFPELELGFGEGFFRQRIGKD